MLRALKTPVAFCLVNSSKILIYSLLACLFILFSSQTHAQSLRSAYPVQVTAFLPPPHSLYLGDYCSSTKEKLVVNLLNRDLQEPELEVKLHLSIRSSGGITLETKDYRVYPSIGLHAGTPCQLTKDDLCPYFQQENLDIQGTLPGGKLPEGLLEICITVLETHTGRVVSSASCARAWINLNRPPLLNLPANSAAFPFREPLNILFQWTPRHQALSSVEYEFVLKEIVDEAIAPQAAFPYSREIYTTTLRSTNLAYTPLQPPLQENRQYAWQVRAAVRDGFEELNVFENQGYSEIHTFSIRPGCFPPTGVSHRQHLQHLVVEWTPPANAGQSVVAYRSKAAGGDWHSVQGNAGYANLTDLTHSIEYEYKAGTRCVDGSIRYGEVHTALLENTREDLEASCGILPKTDNSNTAPLKFMNPGDVFLAGDFPVSVTRVSGENGYFSGNGWIRIPFMNDAKVAVEFKAIGINADSRLTSGVVETSYDQFEANIANMDDLWHGGSTTPTSPGTVTTDAKAGFEIPEEGGVKLSEDGTILLIIDPDGNPVGTIPVPDQYAEAVQKGLPVTITIEDAKGTTCEVKTGGKETGSISPTGKKGDPLAPGSFDETKLAGGKAVVEFLPAPESRYAFDTWKDYYRKVSLIVSRGGYEFIGSYAVPFKLIPPGKSDPVAVRVRVVDKKLNPDSILYKTSTGYEVKPEEGILTLSAGKENSYQDLYALYPDGQGGYLTLGKLKILSYSEPTFPVVLIPVNGNRVDESQIETYLNSREVYGSLGIRWEVSQDTTFTCPDENLHSDGSDLFSRYTDEMKRLNSAYRASRGQLDNKTVYLFVLRSGSVDGLYAGGDMPRSGQFGYLFTEGSHDLNRTIAHELAHGKFRLRHTFDSEYGQVEELARGGTKNLMDYGTGTELAKWQWDEIFNPALLVSPFESDEEAMEMADPRVVCIDKNNLHHFETSTYLSPAGNAIVLEADMEPVAFYSSGEPDKALCGRLMAIKKGDVNYSAWTDDSGHFIGYAQATGRAENWEEFDKIRITLKVGHDQDAQTVSNEGCEITISRKGANPVRFSQTGCSECKGLPSSSKSTNITASAGKDYLSQLGAKAGKGYQEVPRSIREDRTDVYNYLKGIDETEINEIFESLLASSGRTGVTQQVFISDWETPESKKADMETYLNTLSAQTVAIWIDFDKQRKASVKIKIGHAIRDANSPETNRLLLLFAEELSHWESDKNPLALILDGVAGLVGKLRIDEIYYNPDAPDYNPLPARIYGYVPFRITDEFVAGLTGSNSDEVRYSPSRNSFALLCGVCNGAVDVASGLPEGASFIVKLITNDENIRTNLSEAWGNLTWDKTRELIGEQLQQCGSNPCMLSYCGSYSLFQAATVVIPFTKIGQAGFLAKSLTVIDRMDAVGQSLGLLWKVCGAAIKPVVRESKFLFKVTEAFMEPGFRLMRNNQAYFTLIPIPSPDLTPNLRNAFEQAKLLLQKNKANFESQIRLVDDGSGAPLQDAAGNCLGEIEIPLGNGVKEKVQVLLNKEEAKLRQAAEEVVEEVGEDIVSDALKAKILHALSKNQADELIAELGANRALKTAMEANEVVPEVWKRIYDGISEFRNENGYLETLKKMTRYHKEAGGSGIVKYYRVQGGQGSSTAKVSKELLIVEPNGNIKFNYTTYDLNISTNDKIHAEYFLNSRRLGGEIIEFEVPKWLDDEIKAAAVPQYNANTNLLNRDKSAPKIVDPIQPGNPIELPSKWHKLIEQDYIKGSAKIIK